MGAVTLGTCATRPAACAVAALLPCVRSACLRARSEEEVDADREAQPGDPGTDEQSGDPDHGFQGAPPSSRQCVLVQESTTASMTALRIEAILTWIYAAGFEVARSRSPSTFATEGCRASSTSSSVGGRPRFGRTLRPALAGVPRGTPRPRGRLAGVERVDRGGAHAGRLPVEAVFGGFNRPKAVGVARASAPGGRRCTTTENAVRQARARPNRWRRRSRRFGRRRLKAQLEPAREQRRPAAERDRRDQDEDLVQEPGVGELAGQVAAAHDPDVPVPAASISSCTVATSSLVNATGASGTTAGSRWVKTQHGISYGHFHSAGPCPRTRGRGSTRTSLRPSPSPRHRR